MPDARDKTATLAALDAAYAALHDLAAEIDEPHGTWQGAVGAWSIVNLLQHIDGWLVLMTEAVERLVRGERPSVEGQDLSDIDAWNRRFVEARGEQSLADALRAWEADHAAFRQAVASVPEDRFAAKKTINRLVEGTAVEHYAEHAAQIRAFWQPAS